MKEIILASKSPRRKELLKILIGNNFKVRESSYQEDNMLNMPPKELILYHSLEKGKDVQRREKNAVVISADTVVVFSGKIFGKPKTKEKATKMLKSFSNNVVEVMTGIAVLSEQKELQDYEITKLKMKNISDQEIRLYLESKEPLGLAGAFGIQSKAAVFIKEIQGDYFNVVGLPLFKLNNLLNRVGISIFDYRKNL